MSDLEKRKFQISKSLSKLLRHQAVREKLTIDSNGFVPVTELLRHKYLKSLQARKEDLYDIVFDNAKQRFKLAYKDQNGLMKNIDKPDQIPNNVNVVYVCAVQGHSISVEAHDLIKLEGDAYPAVIVHGTYKKFLKDIYKSGGLSKMRRNHIHFAEGLTQGVLQKIQRQQNGENATGGKSTVISGMRNSCDVLIYLDVDKIKASDLTFYRSSNGVILSAGDSKGFVSIDYFDKVVDLAGKSIKVDSL